MSKYVRPWPPGVIEKTDRIEANGVCYDLKPTFVYFVEDTRWPFIKIGSTADPIKRLSVLSTAAPGCFRIAGLARGTSRHEKDLRLYFREHRHAGEWFKPTAELISFIELLPSLTDYMEGVDVPLLKPCPDFMFRLYQLGYSFEQIGEFFGQTKQNAHDQIGIRTKDRWPKGRAPLTDIPIEESYQRILVECPMLSLVS